MVGDGFEAVVKVGRKGVIVLPKAVRETLGLREGSLILLELEGGEITLRPLTPRRVSLGGRVSRIVREAKLEELQLEG